MSAGDAETSGRTQEHRECHRRDGKAVHRASSSSQERVFRDLWMGQRARRNQACVDGRRTPDEADARLMLVMCSAHVNYLMSLPGSDSGQGEGRSHDR